MYWTSIGHYEAVAVGNWWYWVSRGHLCLYILHKVEIWTGVTDASLTTLKDRATQLLIKYKSGALVTQKQLILPFHPGLPWLAADKVVALNVPVRDFSFCLFKDIMFWFSSYFKIKPLVAAALYLWPIQAHFSSSLRKSLVESCKTHLCEPKK